jgi:rubrerythrin
MGKKTEENLSAAFAGESQARNKYTYFAAVARKEGYHYNLKEAIDGEGYETTEMYPTFAKEAEEEGELKVAALFREIAKIEAHHRDRFKRLLEMVEKGTVYNRDEPIKWKCSVCGYVHEGTEPPGTCPCCSHRREYFEPENMGV